MAESRVPAVIRVRLRARIRVPAAVAAGGGPAAVAPAVVMLPTGRRMKVRTDRTPQRVAAAETGVAAGVVEVGRTARTGRVAVGAAAIGRDVAAAANPVPAPGQAAVNQAAVRERRRSRAAAPMMGMNRTRRRSAR